MNKFRVRFFREISESKLFFQSIFRFLRAYILYVYLITYRKKYLSTYSKHDFSGDFHTHIRNTNQKYIFLTRLRDSVLYYTPPAVRCHPNLCSKFEFVTRISLLYKTGILLQPALDT